MWIPQGMETEQAKEVNNWINLNSGSVITVLEDFSGVPLSKTSEVSNEYISSDDPQYQKVRDYLLDEEGNWPRSRVVNRTPKERETIKEMIRRRRRHGAVELWGSKQADAVKTIKEYLKEEQNAGKEYAELAEAMEEEGFLKSDVKKIRGIQTDEQRHRGVLKQVLDRQLERSKANKKEAQYAFEVTKEDIFNVLMNNDLIPVADYDNPLVDEALDIVRDEESRVEAAALMGDDIDEQTDYAYEEIYDILRESGFIDTYKKAEKWHPIERSKKAIKESSKKEAESEEQKKERQQAECR